MKLINYNYINLSICTLLSTYLLLLSCNEINLSLLFITLYYTILYYTTKILFLKIQNTKKTPK